MRLWSRLTLAVRPVLTSRPAVLKCSEVILTWPNLPSSCAVAGRTSGKGQKRQRATLVHGAVVRGGKGACAHEDENGGDDREEDSEAQHNAAARGGAHVKSRSTWLGAQGHMQAGLGGSGVERAQAGAERHEAA